MNMRKDIAFKDGDRIAVLITRKVSSGAPGQARLYASTEDRSGPLGLWISLKDADKVEINGVYVLEKLGDGFTFSRPSWKVVTDE